MINKEKKIVLLGIGNVLQKDDGIGVYAAQYLLHNYTFSPETEIINGGVEGIKLLDIFIEHDEIIILDTIMLDDTPGSIYNIPAEKLGGYGLNSGSAHEIGVLQCLDMLDLQGRARPKADIIAIIPHEITFAFDLSKTIQNQFEHYIRVILSELRKRGITVEKKEKTLSLQQIIDQFKCLNT